MNKSLSPNAKERPTLAMMARKGVLLTGGGTGRLNPPFVAEMMGYPSYWTELPFLRGAENR